MQDDRKKGGISPSIENLRAAQGSRPNWKGCVSFHETQYLTEVAKVDRAFILVEIFFFFFTLVKI